MVLIYKKIYVSFCDNMKIAGTKFCLKIYYKSVVFMHICVKHQYCHSFSLLESSADANFTNITFCDYCLISCKLKMIVKRLCAHFWISLVNDFEISNQIKKIEIKLIPMEEANANLEPTFVATGELFLAIDCNLATNSNKRFHKNLTIVFQ